MIATKEPGLASRLVNGILAIKPLADFAKHQARKMIVKWAEDIGVYWMEELGQLRSLDWEPYLAQVKNPQLTYPEYYFRPFHAYEQGNLCWDAALEVELAAKAVHSRIWPDGGVESSAKLRQNYHDIIKAQISQTPQQILDLGCGVGLSTFALQAVFPEAKITGLDLSPYFLAVAKYRTEERNSPNPPQWVNAAAESTGLPDASFDLVSLFLVFHELPQSAAKEIFREVRRLLRPGGHLTIMDMNPQSEHYAKMPAYVLTLMKSTEPYLDEYLSLDMAAEIAAAGFHPPVMMPNSPHHRTIIAQAL